MRRIPAFRLAGNRAREELRSLGCGSLIWSAEGVPDMNGEQPNYESTFRVVFTVYGEDFQGPYRLVSQNKRVWHAKL